MKTFSLGILAKLASVRTISPASWREEQEKQFHNYRIYVCMYMQMFVCKMSMCCPQTRIWLNWHAQPTINQSKLIITFFCRHIAPSYSSCLNKILWPMLYLLLCSKAMEFIPFWHPSHSILQCLQNCVKNTLLQTVSQTISKPVFLLACIRACVCTCAGVVCKELTQYWLYNYYFWGFNVHIFVDPALVGEIWCCRNGRYYYYSHSIFLITFFPDSSISPLTKDMQLSESSSGWVHIYIYTCITFTTSVCLKYKMVLIQTSYMETGVGINTIVPSWKELVFVLGVTGAPQVSIAALGCLVVGFQLINQLLWNKQLVILKSTFHVNISLHGIITVSSLSLFLALSSFLTPSLLQDLYWQFYFL